MHIQCLNVIDLSVHVIPKGVKNRSDDHVTQHDMRMIQRASFAAMA